MFDLRAHLTEFQDLGMSVVSFAKGEALKIAATEVISDVRDKTLKGVDPQGASFAPYRPSTVKQRKRLGLQTAHVDLYRTTDGLLDGIHSEGRPEDGSFIITVRDGDQAKAGGLNYGVPKRNLVARPFLAEPGRDTMDKVEKNVVKGVEKLIAK